MVGLKGWQPSNLILVCHMTLQHTPIYRFSRVCLLTSFNEFGNKDNSEATFTIPDVKNLSTSHACNLNIILISCGTVHIWCEYLSFSFVLSEYFFISIGQVGQTIGEDNCSQNNVPGSSLQSKSVLTYHPLSQYLISFMKQCSYHNTMLGF
jgi:hypothetical protein